MRAVKNDSRYRVDDLLLDFTDHLEVTGELHASRLALQDLYHAFGFEEDERFIPYQGTVRGHSSIHYTLGFAQDSPNGTLRAGLDYEFLNANLGGFGFDAGRLLGQWKWLDWGRGVDTGQLEVQHFGLSKGGGTVNVSGRMGLGSELAFNVSADRIPVEQTEGFESTPQLAGIYSVLGQIRGTASVPKMHLDVTMTGLTWDGDYLGDARAYVRLTDRTDPWVATAQTWEPNQLPEVDCAGARLGFAQGRWAPGAPMRTVDGPQPARESADGVLGLR